MGNSPHLEQSMQGTAHTWNSPCREQPSREQPTPGIVHAGNSPHLEQPTQGTAHAWNRPRREQSSREQPTPGTAHAGWSPRLTPRKWLSWHSRLTPPPLSTSQNSQFLTKDPLMHSLLMFYFNWFTYSASLQDAKKMQELYIGPPTNTLGFPSIPRPLSHEGPAFITPGCRDQHRIPCGRFIHLALLLFSDP